jgi:hypothetical protein
MHFVMVESKLESLTWQDHLFLQQPTVSSLLLTNPNANCSFASCTALDSEPPHGRHLRLRLYHYHRITFNRHRTPQNSRYSLSSTSLGCLSILVLRISLFDPCIGPYSAYSRATLGHRDVISIYLYHIWWLSMNPSITCYLPIHPIG